jgi:hypothetical protein
MVLVLVSSWAWMSATVQALMWDSWTAGQMVELMEMQMVDLWVHYSAKLSACVRET